MALTGLTEVQFTNLNVTGVATFAQTVGIAGTLTYEDVTNIDSVGVVTARVGVNVPAGQLDVGSNVKIGHSGVTTASSFKTGTSNVHSTGYECTNVNASGIITAAQFSGDGGGLTGVSGLGTALGTGLLSNIFYFDKTLTVTSNTTVNPPASASTAYTHFTEIELADGIELTIEDGDALVIDVLGLDPT